MSAAEDALGLARAGLPVFPCGASKAPLVAGGFLAATADLALVRHLWRRLPDALPGVPTGEPSRLWVLDLDTDRRTGEMIGENAVARLGIEPPRHVVRTRSGGAHWIYGWHPDLPRNTAGRLPGVDTRGSGGYVVPWEPAILISARADRSLPYPPAALVRALAPPARPATTYTFTAPRNCSRWAAAALAAELRQVVTAPDGHRNDQLNRSSFKVGQISAAAGLDLEEITAALMQAATMAGLSVPEASRTIASGLAAGAQFPRQTTHNPRPTTAAQAKGNPWTRA